RQTSNTYQMSTLTPGPGVTEQANVPAQTPVSPESVTPHEGKEVVQPVSEGGLVKAPRAREAEPPSVPSALDVGRQHEPTWADERLDPDQVMERLRGAFGQAELLELRPNDPDPAAYSTARGRRLPLEGSHADFRAAVDQL